jgi:hypothetical protein
MTRAEHRPNQVDMWQTLFNEQRLALTVVAEMVLRCHVSPEQILSKALTALENSPLYENFGQVSATRAVVKAAIAHNREAANSSIESETLGPAKKEFPGTSHIGMLPWSERAVYFLRGVLGYSRRDTALLLGMSDANIDQLYKFAEKRIGCCNDISCRSQSTREHYSNAIKEKQAPSH